MSAISSLSDLFLKDLLEVMVNKVLLDQLDLLDLLVKLDQLAGVVLEV